jgi:hypothetical protein
MSKVLEDCNRDNLDKRRLATFYPEHNKDILKLPVYSVQEIDKLMEIFASVDINDLSHIGRVYTLNIKSCYSFFKFLDIAPYESSALDCLLIVDFLLVPFEDVPLWINSPYTYIRWFVKWRLCIRK